MTVEMIVISPTEYEVIMTPVTDLERTVLDMIQRGGVYPSFSINECENGSFCIRLIGGSARWSQGLIERNKASHVSNLEVNREVDRP